MEDEKGQIGVFKRLVAAVRQHHEAGNGIHTELLQEADDLLKKIEGMPHKPVGDELPPVEEPDFKQDLSEATEGHVGSDS
ncbi:MAG: hypothetical protein ACLQVJ_17080 [Syntrophobacteraceae bacterium]